MIERYCMGIYYNKGGKQDFKIGKFHQWGSNFEEFENGAGNYSVAIVELPDGTVVMPMADDIRFLDDVGIRKWNEAKEAERNAHIDN